MHDLTDTDRELLDIESKWWQYSGAKEQAFRDRAGLSATQAYQRLNVLIDSEAALAYAPLTVKRLQHLRGTRQRSRSIRR